MRRLAIAATVISGAAVFIAFAAGAQPPARVEKGNLVTLRVPETPPALAERLRQYQNTRSAAFLDWTADGRGVFIATRFGNTAQVHRVDAPLGMRRQITFFNEPVADAAAQPGGNSFLFTKDTGGDEYDQLYRFDLASGRAMRLSDGRKSLNRGAFWSEDGRRIVWTYTPEGTSKYQIVTAPSANPASSKVVFDRDGAWSAIDLSDDGAMLMLNRYVRDAESYTYTLRLADGTLTQIGAGSADKPVSYGGGEFTPDGRALYVVTDEGSEFSRLARFDLATGEKTLITGDLDWDVESFDLSPDGRMLAMAVNEDGVSRLIFRSADDGRDAGAPKLPAGVIGGGRFSPQSTQFAFTLNRATSPADVYVFDLAGGALTQWTDSEVGGLDKSALGDASLIRYPTFDGRTISAFMYKPAGPGPHPVVIRHNGGPSAQFRPVFSAENQAWAKELGFAVIGPNIRGSTGYGKTFTDLDNGMKREDALKDIGALLDWIAKQPDLDAKRVAVYGASYGGYIAYGSLIEYGDRIAGAISNVGISDFNTFLLATAEYRRDLRRVEYGDERVPEMKAFLERISSVRNAGRITKPLFVIQGANDPRVPASQAEQMLAAVEKNGGEPWYMLAKDEGHGFAKKVNRDAAIEASALFLQTRILGRRAN